jgi:hypothetical protein
MAGPKGQLRRALLRAARDRAVLQDQIDCAELALEAGLRDVARILYGLVFLQIGFSPEGLSLQDEVEIRSGLWNGPGRPEAGFRHRPARRLSVEVAAAELRRLFQLHPELCRTEDLSEALPDAAAAPPLGLDDGLCRRVGDLLQSVPHLEAEGRLGTALDALADELGALGPIRLEAHLDEDAFGLATLFAVRETRRLALIARALINAEPTGALFVEAGRMSPCGLGPYFSNIRMVIRDARDVLALISAATDGEVSGEALAVWCALLSIGLSCSEAAELAAELGDQGRTGALRALFALTARWGPIERRREVLWRIRDAGLDLGDLTLAEASQQLVAAWSPASKVEWSILGDIRATLGDAAGAEAAFAHWRRLDPGDESAKQRLEAVQAGAVGVFDVDGGYQSSPVRRLIRRRRLHSSA